MDKDLEKAIDKLDVENAEKAAKDLNEEQVGCSLEELQKENDELKQAVLFLKNKLEDTDNIKVATVMMKQLNYTIDLEKQLDKYYNIEKQLGCPLEALCKAVENGIYYRRPRLDDEIQKTNVRLIHAYNRFGFASDQLLGLLDLTDYKKIWWLKEDKSE